MWKIVVHLEAPFAAKSAKQAVKLLGTLRYQTISAIPKSRIKQILHHFEYIYVKLRINQPIHIAIMDDLLAPVQDFFEGQIVSLSSARSVTGHLANRIVIL